MSIFIDIKKKFNDFSLDVKFENSQGTLGMLGASGCGKTITLKCLAGLETPDSGIIRVGGKTVFDSEKKINIKPQERNVGYLFQSYALFPNMTVWENISIALKKDTPNKDEKIKKLIERYKIKGLENRYPVGLSGGQQQRVALARIFAYEPEILLLDEPFSALDSYLRENMQADLLDVIKDYDGDVVMVTHSRDEAYKICDRLLILDDGQIMGDDHPKELFKNPQNVSAAKISGCKNISKIEKISETRVFAKAWGLELDVDGPVGENTHIGIRAHYFTMHDRSNAGNKIPLRVKNEIVGPFEKSVILENPNCIEKKDYDESKEIWWICKNDTDISDLEYLYLDKKDILLLKG